PMEISRAFDELSNMTTDMEHLTDLTNTLRIVCTEHVMHLMRKDRRMIILEEMKLHPKIRHVSRRLFESGDYNVAVFKAFKELEKLVKKKSGCSDPNPVPLMGRVFSENNPILILASDDEQRGYMHLFMGAMAGIRNIEAHGEIRNLDFHKTLEYLAFASLLAKKLDETKKAD
ncbi:MAG: TIGR02391 family protein, partial [Candidatus Bathyarchaeota archaeon]|nr:TIGR02391 family protein [Candidatus Bathyarchaeota archaeon]